MENDENNPYYSYENRKVAAAYHKTVRIGNPLKHNSRSPPKKLNRSAELRHDSDEESRSSTVSSKSQRRRWQPSPQPPVIKAKMETPTNSPRSPHVHSGCRICEDKDGRKRRAAVKIQTAWRGFAVRNVKRWPVSVLLEIRLRRTETYVLSLQQELAECRHQLAQEQKLTGELTTLLRQTFLDVRELKQWRLQMSAQPQTAQPPSSVAFDWKSETTGVLKWTGCDSAQFYEIFIDGVSHGQVSAPTTKALLADLEPNRQYQLTVRTVTVDKVESPQSDPVVIEFKPPDTPDLSMIAVTEFVSQNFSQDFLSDTLSQFSQVELNAATTKTE